MRCKWQICFYLLISFFSDQPKSDLESRTEIRKNAVQEWLSYNRNWWCLLRLLSNVLPRWNKLIHWLRSISGWQNDSESRSQYSKPNTKIWNSIHKRYLWNIKRTKSLCCITFCEVLLFRQFNLLFWCIYVAWKNKHPAWKLNFWPVLIVNSSKTWWPAPKHIILRQ